MRFSLKKIVRARRRGPGTRVANACCATAYAIALVFRAAQAQPAALVQEKAIVQEPQAIPVLDRDGICLAWRTATAVFSASAQGHKGAAVAGNSLKVQAGYGNGLFVILEKIEEKHEPVLWLRWLARDGAPQGSYKMTWQRDHPLPQFCSNATATRWLVADAATARLRFLHSDGTLLREVALFDEAPYVNERPLFLAANTENFLVATQKFPSAPQPPGKPELICFDADGHERWRQELAYGTAGGVAVSETGTAILAGSYEVVAPQASVSSALQFFDQAGRRQCQAAGLFRQALFSQNGEKALIVDRRQARLLHLPRGEELWQSNLTARAEMFVTAAADANLENLFGLIATSTFKHDRFVFEQARLVKLDAADQQQQTVMIDADLIAPVLAMSREGDQLTLAAEGALRQYLVVKPKDAAAK